MPIFGAPDFPTKEAPAAACAHDIMTLYNARGRMGIRALLESTSGNLLTAARASMATGI
jgi:hypothetical protein